MAPLPVRCPRCAADLTVGREHLNRPVRCGACGRPFVPVADPGGREPDDLPPRPKRGGGPVFGILSLIFGVASLGLCCCGLVPAILAAGAVATGLIGVFVRDGRPLAITGLVLGGVSLAVQGAKLAFGFGGLDLGL